MVIAKKTRISKYSNLLYFKTQLLGDGHHPFLTFKIKLVWSCCGFLVNECGNCSFTYIRYTFNISYYIISFLNRSRRLAGSKPLKDFFNKVSFTSWVAADTTVFRFRKVGWEILSEKAEILLQPNPNWQLDCFLTCAIAYCMAILLYEILINFAIICYFSPITSFR